MDGVGIGGIRGNAVHAAKMPFYNGILKKYPHTRLSAAGLGVGVPRGTMGNSELGHMTLGAGRIINQFLCRFQAENLAKNKHLNDFIKSMPDGGAVHVIGIASTGRVHSNLDDALKVVKIIKQKNIKIIWHFISDGRDIEVKTAPRYVRQIRRALGKNFVFGSLVGRWYAFDRDNNLDRTKQAYRVIAEKGIVASNNDIGRAIRESYKNGITDEFIKPVRFAEYTSGIKKEDGILFFNYRADRARQILEMLLKGGHRRILCFSQYGGGLDKKCPAIIPNETISNTLGDVLAKNKVSQLRIAETEKYNHVTYFFDAERTIDYPRGKKIKIPSPKIATFDMKPEMSAAGITNEFLKNIAKFDVIIMNYANGDMVGHTGNFKAAVRAMEVLDKQLSKIVPAVLKLGGTILITADHGNAERMIDWRGRIWKGHTTNDVPFIAVSAMPLKLGKTRGAGLANVAPTMLGLLGIKPPKEMAEQLTINS